MTYTPPTFANGGPPALSAANLNAMAQAIAAAAIDHGVDVSKIDAANDNARFQSAALAAKAGVRAAPAGTSSDALGTVTIDIPAGSYTITELAALLGDEALTAKAKGLRIRGAGSDLTFIVFEPTSAGPMMTNDYWLNLGIEGVTFHAKTAGCTFMQSHTTHSAQDYTFTDVSWAGAWKYVFDLQGTNNNSEFAFYSCETSGMAADGAFLYIGTTSTVDQFLNYWFYGFKHWSTSAPLIDAAKGGHFHLFGVDVSAWGEALTAPGYVLNLRGATHAWGVQSLTADGLRVEAKSAHAGLIYSEWADGNVSIQCDWSSQTTTYTYGDVISLYFSNVAGPIYNFHDSTLAGTIRIAHGSNIWKRQPCITVRDTLWLQKLTPSEAVNYVSSTNGQSKPEVVFERCRNASNQDPITSGSSASVWDATVGWDSGPLVKTLRKRSISVRGVYGAITGTNVATINLPLYALVTAVTAFAPAGVVSEGDGATWTVATTDAVPEVIAAVTVAGARSGGYSTRTDLAAPYLCSTRAKATVTVTPSDTTATSVYAGVTIEGYW